MEYRRHDGSIAGDHVRLIDFDNPDANDWLAVNQYTVIEGQNNRRPDIVVVVNGLPLGIIELKNTADGTHAAYKQIQTYKPEIPSLMHFNEVTVVSDGSKRASVRSRQTRNGSKSGARSKASMRLHNALELDVS